MERSSHDTMFCSYGGLLVSDIEQKENKSYAQCTKST